MSRIIPIPSSFSTKAVAARDEMAPTPTPLPSKAASSKKDDEAATFPPEQQCLGDRRHLSSVSPTSSPSLEDRLLAPLNEQWILQLENALQIYLFQHQKSCVSYASLCSLVPKLVLAEGSNSSSSSQRKEPLPETPLPLQSLSNEERLWHDFACVVVPRLYTMVERHKDDGKVVLELQRVYHYQGNRHHELRRLLDDAQKHGVKQKLSAKILDWLAQDKARRQKPAAPTARSTPIPAIAANSAMGTILTNRTVVNENAPLHHHQQQQQQQQTLKELEDRVRAKAKERLRHVERAEAQSKHHQQQQPNFELLTVADTIFSQARHALRQRQQTVGTNHRFHRLNKPNTSAVSTVCKVSLSNLLKALPGYTHPQQLWPLVQTIATKCPEWLSWKIEKDAKAPIEAPNLALISVETSNYKTMRAKLSSSSSSKATTSLSSSCSKQLQASPSSVTAPMPSPPLPQPPTEQHHTPRPIPKTTVPAAVTVSGSKRSAASAGLVLAGGDDDGVKSSRKL